MQKNIEPRGRKSAEISEEGKLNYLLKIRHFIRIETNFIEQLSFGGWGLLENLDEAINCVSSISS